MVTQESVQRMCEDLIDPVHDHEARGLLNAVVFVAHCLRIGAGTRDERRMWLTELQGAAERLRELETPTLGDVSRSS